MQEEPSAPSAGLGVAERHFGATPCARSPDGVTVPPLPIDVKRAQYSLGGRRIKTLCSYQVDSGAI
jgi:hypothetical protein